MLERFLTNFEKLSDAVNRIADEMEKRNILDRVEDVKSVCPEFIQKVVEPDLAKTEERVIANSVIAKVSDIDQISEEQIKADANKAAKLEEKEHEADQRKEVRAYLDKTIPGEYNNRLKLPKLIALKEQTEKEINEHCLYMSENGIDFSHCVTLKDFRDAITASLPPKESAETEIPPNNSLSFIDDIAEEVEQKKQEKAEPKPIPEEPENRMEKEEDCRKLLIKLMHNAGTEHAVAFMKEKADVDSLVAVHYEGLIQFEKDLEIELERVVKEKEGEK